MRFSSYAAGLIAAAALMFQVSAAQAQITLEIDGQVVATNTSSGASSTSLGSGITVDGLKISSATASYFDGQLSVTFGFAGGSKDANTSASGTTFEVIFTAPTVIGSFQTNASISTTGGNAANFTGSIKAATMVGTTNDLNPVTVTPSTPSVPVGNVPYTNVSTPSTSVVVNGSISGTDSTSFPGGAFTITNPSNKKISGSYIATSYLNAVPEPTGVLMGLLGLPCLGAVVFFARRRSSALAAMVA